MRDKNLPQTNICQNKYLKLCKHFSRENCLLPCFQLWFQFMVYEKKMLIFIDHGNTEFVFGVILVRIQFKWGKIQTRITPTSECKCSAHIMISYRLLKDSVLDTLAKCLSLPSPRITESCIKIKINLNLYLHTSRRCFKKFYESSLKSS